MRDGNFSWDTAAPRRAVPHRSGRRPCPGARAPTAIVGTCYPATDSALASTKRNPAPRLDGERSPRPTTCPIPGHQPAVGHGLLTDTPPWGKGCTTGTVTDDHCLFDKSAYYLYDSWRASATTDHATRDASDTDTGRSSPTGCTYRAGASLTVDLGDRVHGPAWPTTGLLLLQHRLRRRQTASGKVTGRQSYRFKGTFLNANPPKFVTARFGREGRGLDRPRRPEASDRSASACSILRADGTSGTTAGGTLVVPLGPDKPHSCPTPSANFAPVRQAIIDASTPSGPTARRLPAPSTLRRLHADRLGALQHRPVLRGPDSTRTTTYRGLQALLHGPEQAGRCCGTSARQQEQLQVDQQGPCPTETASRFRRQRAVLGRGPSLRRDGQRDGRRHWARRGRPRGPCSAPICWACQKNSVVVVTDGMPNTEITFPTADHRRLRAINADYPSRTAGPAPAVRRRPAPKVADWLNKTELRPDMAQGAKQRLNFHTVGFSRHRRQRRRTR